MKQGSEDAAAPAGGPWEECFQAAVQLALRAGQEPSVSWTVRSEVALQKHLCGRAGLHVEALLSPRTATHTSRVAGIVVCATAPHSFRVSYPDNKKTAAGRQTEVESVHIDLLIIRKALAEEKRVSTKTSAADLVTETDRLVEDLIISELRKRFPSHRFIAEEAAASGASCVLTPSPTWIIDPIDGTCNFVHRFPTVAVSIGFAVRQELEFGVIHHCTEERLYTGRRGQGAFCDGQRLRVSGETELSRALVLTEIGPRRDPATLRLFLSNMERLLHGRAHGVRVIGSSTLALCHLASGAADAYYQFGLHCWDLAAATVIVREAGGIVMDTSGGPLDLMSCRVVAAGTREMAMLIAQALQTINCGRDDEK